MAYPSFMDPFVGAQTFHLPLEACYSCLFVAQHTQLSIIVWWDVWYFRIIRIIFNEESVSFSQASFIINSYVKKWDKANCSDLVIPVLAFRLKKSISCLLALIRILFGPMMRKLLSQILIVLN